MQAAEALESVFNTPTPSRSRKGLQGLNSRRRVEGRDKGRARSKGSTSLRSYGSSAMSEYYVDEDRYMPYHFLGFISEPEFNEFSNIGIEFSPDGGCFTLAWSREWNARMCATIEVIVLKGQVVQIDDDYMDPIDWEEQGFDEEDILSILDFEKVARVNHGVRMNGAGSNSKIVWTTPPVDRVIDKIPEMMVRGQMVEGEQIDLLFKTDLESENLRDYEFACSLGRISDHMEIKGRLLHFAEDTV
jgi:hypothetical protein